VTKIARLFARTGASRIYGARSNYLRIVAGLQSVDLRKSVTAFDVAAVNHSPAAARGW
jgi:hypothetical protein